MQIKISAQKLAPVLPPQKIGTLAKQKLKKQFRISLPSHFTTVENQYRYISPSSVLSSVPTQAQR
jgi:hypothetical protein